MSQRLGTHVAVIVLKCRHRGFRCIRKRSEGTRRSQGPMIAIPVGRVGHIALGAIACSKTQASGPYPSKCLGLAMQYARLMSAVLRLFSKYEDVKRSCKLWGSK